MILLIRGLLTQASSFSSSWDASNLVHTHSTRKHTHHLNPKKPLDLSIDHVTPLPSSSSSSHLDRKLHVKIISPAALHPLKHALITITLSRGKEKKKRKAVPEVVYFEFYGKADPLISQSEQLQAQLHLLCFFLSSNKRQDILIIFRNCSTMLSISRHPILLLQSTLCTEL